MLALGRAWLHEGFFDGLQPGGCGDACVVRVAKPIVLALLPVLPLLLTTTTTIILIPTTSSTTTFATAIAAATTPLIDLAGGPRQIQ
jgi:hypothetical protein